MSWIFLVIAGLLEIVWAFTMKQSQGFTRPAASIVTIVAMIASFGLLSLAMRALPLGTAYTIWTGIGAVGAFVVGVFVLGEPANVQRVLAASLIVSGLMLMKLGTPPENPRPAAGRQEAVAAAKSPSAQVANDNSSVASRSDSSCMAPSSASGSEAMSRISSASASTSPQR